MIIEKRQFPLQLTPVGTTIFQNILAKDKDTGVNGLVEYSIVKGDGLDLYDEGMGRGRIHSEDGYGYFAINLPHQGQVTVNRTLDFEKTQRYYVTVVATVSLLIFIFFIYIPEPICVEWNKMMKDVINIVIR